MLGFLELFSPTEIRTDDRVGWWVPPHYPHRSHDSEKPNRARDTMTAAKEHEEEWAKLEAERLLLDEKAEKLFTLRIRLLKINMNELCIRTH